MKIEPFYIDIAPTYISFEIEACKGDGTALDPTGTPTLAIYEEGGADGTYDNSQVSGSPFNLAKINSITGNYGVLVAKSLFTAGKLYRCIYSAVVDGIATKKVELLQACNGGVNVMSATKGAIQVSYAKSGGVVEVVKGNTISIPYGPFGKDITGRKVYFAAKQLLSDATYKIAVKEITAQITNAATFTGTIPLTSAELNLAPGNYYAEIESRATDGTTLPCTEVKFILKVEDRVIG